MKNLRKYLNVLSVYVVFGAAALVSVSSGAGVTPSQDQAGLKQVALSLEKALPAIVSAQDYRSASNTAFLLATARSRLEQTSAACAALSQSLEYYRKAIAEETGEPQLGFGIDDHGDGMTMVRAKFGCTVGRAA
jgi:hypothetical protein